MSFREVFPLLAVHQFSHDFQEFLLRPDNQGRISFFTLLFQFVPFLIYRLFSSVSTVFGGTVK